MGRYQSIELTGFEEALAEYLSESFAWSATAAAPGARLVDGRSLFVQDMPETEEIAATAEAGYDEAKEPTLAVFTNPGPGYEPSLGRHVKHEWDLRLVLRFGTVPEDAKRLLEELVAFVLKESQGPRMGKFRVKRARLVFRPVIASREGDDHAYAHATLRFTVILA